MYLYLHQLNTTSQKTKTVDAIADGFGDIAKLKQEKNEEEDDADEENIDRTYVHYVQKADSFA